MLKNLDLMLSFMDIMEDIYSLDIYAHTVYNFKVIINGFSQIITHSVHPVHMVESSRMLYR